MIETLSAAEARMKKEIKASYGMNLATESARRTKDWVKTATYYNCGGTGHLLRTCKKPKKNRKNDNSFNEKDDDKTDDEASKKINKTDKKRFKNRAKFTKKKIMRQRARAMKEDLKSVSDSSENDEAAYLIKEIDETAVNGESARYAAEEIAATTKTKESVENEAQNETVYQMSMDSH